MPGLMVKDELPLRLTAPREARPDELGAARLASGSATAAAPVTGFGLKEALPDLLSPPTIWMPAAVTVALPLARTAVDDFESTTTTPGTSMSPLPDTVSDPATVVLRT